MGTVERDEIKITGLTIIRNPHTDSAGGKLLAHFDVETRGLLMRNARLVKTPRGGFVAKAPRVKVDGKPNGLWITDPALAHAVMSAARDVYRFMGGTEAEWTPRGSDEPEDGDDGPPPPPHHVGFLGGELGGTQ